MHRKPHTIGFACPSCRGELTQSAGVWNCPQEDYEFGLMNGIPEFILSPRREKIEEFLTLYQKIRTSERWGSADAAYYMELPYRDTTGKHSAVWKIRARSFDCFSKDVQNVYGDNGNIGNISFLDLGAGNCWMSFRLAGQGYNVVSVDINMDSCDGLGVVSRLSHNGSHPVFPVRAEFAHPPFASSSFDIVAFNASLHYAINPYETIVRTLPLLKPAGSMYVLDSPIYADPASGAAMLEEKIGAFKRDFGVTVRQEFAGSYLTFDGLNHLRNVCIVDFLFPSYGLAWNLRPLAARLTGKRQPASFAVVRIRRHEAHQ